MERKAGEKCLKRYGPGSGAEEKLHYVERVGFMSVVQMHVWMLCSDLD